MPPDVTLRHRVPGSVSAEVVELRAQRRGQGRDRSCARGAPWAVPTAQRWPGRRRRAPRGLPLVVSGVERRRHHRRASARAGWGTAARAIVGCSGIVARAAGRPRPGRVGPGAAAGPGRPRVMTRGLRVRLRAPHGARVHRCPHRPDRARRGRRATLADRRRPLLVGRPRRGPRPRSPSSSATCPLTSTRSRRGWRPTTRSTGPCPRPGRWCRPLDRRLRRPRRDPGRRRRRRAARAAAGWAGNLVTALARSAAGPSASSPTSRATRRHARHPGLAEGRPVRRVVRRLQHPARHPRRHARLLPRQGPRVAGHDPPRRPARVRLRAGHRAPDRVMLRKAYGGAYIVMDSKTHGQRPALAWPSAEIAVMGAKGAVEILHRRANPDDRARLGADYEARLLNPYVAAERGSVDAVIDPAETRGRLAAALEVLATKREPAVAPQPRRTPPSEKKPHRQRAAPPPAHLGRVGASRPARRSAEAGAGPGRRWPRRRPRTPRRCSTRTRPRPGKGPDGPARRVGRLGRWAGPRRPRRPRPAPDRHRRFPGRGARPST